MNSKKAYAMYVPQILLAIIVIMAQLAFRKHQDPQRKDFPRKENDQLPYKWYPPHLPDFMSFAGEPVPPLTVSAGKIFTVSLPLAKTNMVAGDTGSKSNERLYDNEQVIQ